MVARLRDDDGGQGSIVLRRTIIHGGNLKTVFTLFGVLVVPLAILLFAQWPLRDWVQAYSRQTNDVAQVVFALYVAVAITAASYANAHLAAGHQPALSIDAAPRWKRYALLLCIAPWAMLILWTSSAQVWESILLLERFSETGNPGLFVIKFAGWLMALLALGYFAYAVERKP